MLSLLAHALDTSARGSHSSTAVTEHMWTANRGELSGSTLHFPSPGVEWGTRGSGQLGHFPTRPWETTPAHHRAVTAVCVTFTVRNDVERASNTVYNMQYVHSFAGSVRLAAWRCVPLVYIVWRMLVFAGKILCELAMSMSRRRESLWTCSWSPTAVSRVNMSLVCASMPCILTPLFVHAARHVCAGWGMRVFEFRFPSVGCLTCPILACVLRAGFDARNDGDKRRHGMNIVSAS